MRSRLPFWRSHVCFFGSPCTVTFRGRSAGPARLRASRRLIYHKSRSNYDSAQLFPFLASIDWMLSVPKAIRCQLQHNVENGSLRTVPGSLPLADSSGFHHSHHLISSLGSPRFGPSRGGHLLRIVREPQLCGPAFTFTVHRGNTRQASTGTKPPTPESGRSWSERCLDVRIRCGKPFASRSRITEWQFFYLYSFRDSHPMRWKSYPAVVDATSYRILQQLEFLGSENRAFGSLQWPSCKANPPAYSLEVPIPAMHMSSHTAGNLPRKQ